MIINIATQPFISILAPSRERPSSSASVQTSLSYFNPRSLAGATMSLSCRGLSTHYFNPRSLAGATRHMYEYLIHNTISILAPSRERHRRQLGKDVCGSFQSSLPRGSDSRMINYFFIRFYFNPRSLAGATHGQ